MTPNASPHALARRAQNDAIRALYEDTPVPVREIARLAGVTERNVYALVRRLGCRPRVRLASGGGRRIVPLGGSGETPSALDGESVEVALQRCKEAVARAQRLAAEMRAARDRSAATRQGQRAAQAQARALALVVRAMRDLAAIAEERASRKDRLPAARPREPKPGKPRGYQWKPMLVSWPR